MALCPFFIRYAIIQITKRVFGKAIILVKKILRK